MGGKPKKVKSTPKIHPRNKHTGRYDLKALVASEPSLAIHIRPNLHGDDSIDFANPESVKVLNKALLKNQYNIVDWDIPEGYLCPPIPGRADYIHHMADWLCSHNYGKIPKGDKITCLDIGVGASCIYPIIGQHEYGWKFIASDIDENSIASSQRIVDQNRALKKKVEFRLQKEPKDIIYGIITKEEQVDVSICNPPFHASAEEAKKGSLRKVNNLSKTKTATPKLNFGGQNNELWCDGGEKKFIREMVRQSSKFPTSCFWYSSLVSKQSNLNSIYEALEKANAEIVHTIPMGQGNKSSRIVTWTFLTKAQQKTWKDQKWNGRKV
ncbi:23S rRNA (adenine(1618)-N(6))-methyltransferase RlmF [Reichenbachiella carrageenanivorans]|uniref:Ribosomal RNA large subunit methyltransferase F n=1 Tax=Reichenbachiella carrageenanivorans TaxID=2979869 RepID=A0ABY6CWS2_9BACT|nr:23S rRNA (adenine(1618)-N(6))-methyltransferase RlmF [Reichenbachiella carrageenanivorans]UXX78366.1 23S rRNA (adenine(1618)-N(6))-methyltransferase RlmF [Reichenbachiella carrageenanivorans]